MKRKVIAIVGPTASGKSSLGVYIAQKIGGEIVSADSRQVYKGLDIGTGKVTKKERGGIPHYLLDVVSPKRSFSASDYERLAGREVEKILKRKNIPLIVGGTGFYVDALLGKVELPDVPPNPALRAALEEKPLKELLEMLKERDPARAATVEPKHKRRIIRAIEIAQANQSKNASQGAFERDDARTEQFSSKEIAYSETEVSAEPYEILWLGLNPGEEKLKKNIHRRLLARMKAGMVKEARDLHACGLSYKRMKELGLEYRSLAEYLLSEVSKEEMLESLERAIWHYAKRQMRWFKRNKEIHWVANKSEALKLAKDFISG